MEGLIEEGKELLEEDVDPAVLDAGLIAAAQKVEHYEMAGYGTVRTWAEQLGMREAVTLLQQTLDEERATDEKLTKLARQTVNRKAETGANGHGTGALAGAKTRAPAARAGARNKDATLSKSARAHAAEQAGTAACSAACETRGSHPAEDLSRVSSLSS